MHTIQFDEIKDTRGDGNCLLARAELFGVDHHLMFIRVKRYKGVQVAYDEKDEGTIEGIFRVYDYAMHTVKVPGFRGQFITCMHPHGV